MASNQNRDITSLDLASLPYSVEAEQSVLGAIILDPQCIVKVADTLHAEHFYAPQNAAIYGVMSSMFQLSKSIDVVTLLDAIKTQGLYDDAGGKQYILELANFVPSSSNIELYAKIIKDKYVLRSLYHAAKNIESESLEVSGEPDSILDLAEQRIYDIRQGKEVSGLRHIKDVLINETLDRLEKMNNPETKDDFIGIPTGIAGLDVIMTGLNKSDLIVVGARPGMGKTSFGLNICENVAVKANKTVCFFSLEMTRDQLAQRIISSHASIKSEKLRTGNLEGPEWTRLIASSDVLGKAPIYFDESSNITVQEMKAKLRRMKKVDLVIIDYLQLMHSARKTENRVQEVSEITRNLKMLAKDLNVPVIVLAQLSRGTEARGKSHRPGLADLRESGSIEQDADIVLFLYREQYYAADAEDAEEIDANKAECIISKNRHGETAIVELQWDGQFTRFETPDYSHDESYGY